MMSVFMALCILLLFVVIGIGQTIWLKSSALPGLKIPLDGGCRIRGQRLFGDHKTLRGLVLIIPLAALVFYAFGLVLAVWNAPTLHEWRLTPIHWLIAGLLVGSGYMLGELPNSFLKRQLRIAEGQHASRKLQRFIFNILDECDSILGAVVAGMIILPIDLHFILMVIPLGTVLHLTFNRLFIQRRLSFPTLYFLMFLGLSLSLLVVWPLAFFQPRMNASLIRRFTCWGLWFLGVRYEREGQLLTDTNVLLCNHSSWLDQLLIIATIPRPLAFIAHRKYFRMPFLGWVLRRQGSFPKPESLQAAREVRTEILSAIDQGKIVVIFPEATRSEDGFPLPSRSSLRFLPHQVRWQSCWLSGAQQCLPRSQSLWNIRPGTVRMRLIEGEGCLPSYQPKALRSVWIEHWIQDQMVPLHDARDARNFGEKAANLARSLRLQHRVPTGLVLSASIAERMVDPLEPDFSEHLDRVLDRWIENYSTPYVLAIRSSALGEDGTAHSFAGQLESVLHVKDPTGLKKAVRQVMASQRRANAYERLTAQKLLGCAVIIQHQVAARFAGVGFSRMAYRGQSCFIVEYAAGLGEDLVQGKLTPCRVILDRKAGQLLCEENPEQESLMSESQLLAIHRMGMQLEKEWARPIDFEWAMDSQSVLYLLQVRAITSDSQLEKILSNANMNENYPRPVTPFLFSFASLGYQQYFLQLGQWTGVPKSCLRALEPALKNILGIHEGRLYYDLTAVRTCLGVLPARSLLIRFWDEFLGIGTLDLPLKNSQSPRLIFPVIFGIRLMGLMLIFPLLAKRFQRRVKKVLSPKDHTGEPLPMQLQELRSICHIRFHGWGEAALCDAAVMIYTGILRVFLSRMLPMEMRDVWQVRLLSGSETISMKQLEDLCELQTALYEYPALVKLIAAEDWSKALHHIQQASRYRRFRDQFEKWLDLWGTRVSGELMLSEQNYRDDPCLLLKLLAVPISINHQNQNTPDRIRSLLRAAWRYRGVSGVLAAGAACLIAMPSRVAIRAREACRLSQSQLYGCLRSNLQKTGRILSAKALLVEDDDPFFLTFDELMSLLSEHTYSIHTLRQTIAVRRQQYLAWQGKKVAERIGRRQGRPLFTREDLRRDERVPGFIPSSEHCERRMGYPASAGYVRGRIRVLLSTDECHKLQAGEILVTRETDPGWTVALGRAAALVVERGGMLSHGAIVARELGIPAVIGLRDITDELQDGMEIEVDGLKGIIQWVSGKPLSHGAENASKCDAIFH